MLGIFPQAVQAESYYAAQLQPSAYDVGPGQMLFVYTMDTAEQTWADHDTLSFTLPDNFPEWSVFASSTRMVVHTHVPAHYEEFIVPEGLDPALGTYTIEGHTLTMRFDRGEWGEGINAEIYDRYDVGVIVNFEGLMLPTDDEPSIVFTTNASGGTAAHAVVAQPFLITRMENDAAASLSLGDNAVVGEVGTSTLSMVAPFELQPGATITFGVPSNLDISGILSALTPSFSDCLASSTVSVTCTASSTISEGLFTLDIAGIKARHAATGQGISGIYIRNDSDIVAWDLSGALTDTIAPATSTTSTTATTTPTTTSTPEIVTSTPEVVPPAPAPAPAPAPSSGGGGGGGGSGGSSPVQTMSVNTATTSTTTTATVLVAQVSIDLMRGNFYTADAAKSASPQIADDLGIVATTIPSVCAAGGLVRTATSPAVYYCGADNKRYVFAQRSIYDTWFDNFDGVVVISPEDMASLPLGGVVRYRPGSTMVKLQTDPKVYAIAPGGALRWVADEKTAALLYGEIWNRHILDMSDAYFVNYQLGDKIEL